MKHIYTKTFSRRTNKETSIHLRSSKKTFDKLISKGKTRAFQMDRKVLVYAETVTEENINLINPKI